MSVGTVTIQVSPQTAEVLRQLESQAALQRMPFDAYLHTLAEDKVNEPSPQVKTPDAVPLSPQEKVAFLHKWIAGLKRNTPLLSDEAISRESIYTHESR